MRRAGGLALRHPRVTLVLWLIATVGLAAFSPSFEDRVSAPSIDVPGTPSAAAQDTAARYFGVEASIPILLEGPDALVRRQGRLLATALKEDPARRVLTPWDEGQAIPELRPRKNAALLLVVAEAESTFSGETGSAVRDRVDAVIDRPVRASVSGFSVVGADLTEASLQGARDAEIIAIPVLLLVLLLVFRSPLAALVPAVFGFAAVQSGFGAVALTADLVTITDVAGPLTSMMGLALGVDYSLLLVSRFREHLAEGLEPRAAAAAAQAGAGRTVIVAAMTLLVAMLVAIALSPGDFLLSMAVSVALVATISMFGSYLAVPALLSMLGTRIDAWRIGGVQRDAGGWGRFAAAVQRRPVAWGVVASAPLLALSVLALGLDTGPPDVRGLPEDTRARIDAERMASVLGPGWAAPFEIFVSDEKGPVTTPRRLRAMEDWQRRAARIEGVRTVIGPGEIAKRQPALLRADRTLRQTSRSLAEGNRNARRLASGLQDAEGGAGQLAAGLRRARDASRRLDAGADQGSAGARRLTTALTDARRGAEHLRAGVRRARDGSRKLRNGIRRAHSGAGRLTAGARRAGRGAARLSGGARQLADGLRAGQGKVDKLRQAATDAEQDAKQLLLALQTMTVGRADPLYNRALQSAGRLSAFMTGEDPRTGRRVDPEYPGLPAALTQARDQLTQAADGAGQLARGARRLRSGLSRLARGTDRLERGLERIERGASALSSGLSRMAAATAPLPEGLDRLRDGADRLAVGLARLSSGTGRLAEGLGRGAERTSDLRQGLDRAHDRTSDAAQDTAQGERLANVRDRSPRLLRSGYFVLAALDGSRPGARAQASYGVSLDRGGQAARITVIPEFGPNDSGTRELRERLESEVPRLADATRAQAHVGGVAAQITDYRRALGERLPILIVVLSVVTALMLVVVLRAIVLPLISVALNLLTVGAAFGVVALLFQGQEAVLGGPGWADILSLLGTFTIVFGLSLDYQVFILTRMREAWDERNDLDHAITYAIEKTGRVVTGAAAIMGGVFIAFTFSDLTIIKQTGVGLAVAVLIDATLVRLVLLPAAMRLAGRATFWLPGWLDRLLPTVDLEGASR